MPWLLVIGGVAAAGYLLDRAGDAAEDTAKLAKWATVAGGVYVGYRVLQAQGVAR